MIYMFAFMTALLLGGLMLSPADKELISFYSVFFAYFIFSGAFLFYPVVRMAFSMNGNQKKSQIRVLHKNTPSKKERRAA